MKTGKRSAGSGEGYEFPGRKCQKRGAGKRNRISDQPYLLLIEFLDAEIQKSSWQLPELMEGCVEKRELDSICVYLDISTRYSSLEGQLEGPGSI